MGLLSDTKNRQKIVDTISRYCNLLCFLCYVVGLSWFLLLAYAPLNAKTYFSENALLPGLVEGQYYQHSAASNYYDEIKKQADVHKRMMPWSWISLEMMRLGLDTYVQNYTFQYPLKILGEQTLTGRNVYGILRARRASSTESVVMCVPYRPTDSPQEKTYGGLALMLSLAKHMRGHTYWSKDVIFLVTEHEHIGMQAWLDAYHRTQSTKFIHGDDLTGRGGSIQAAISLEIATDEVDHFDIRIEGLNGQLPNLDLVNTITRLCRRENVQPTLHDMSQHYDLESYEGYVRSLNTMLSMMWHQSTGSPTGNHGLFHRYHIEAVTLMGQKKVRGRSQGFYAMGRVLEGIFRSLNNLMERFHQSFFFYILPSTERYVSIGLYMIPFGLMVGSALIKAVALWIDCLSEAKSHAKEVTVTANEDENEQINKTEELEKTQEPKEEGFLFGKSFVAIFPVASISGTFGLASYFGTDFFVGTASPFHMQPGEGLLYGGLALYISALFYPRLLNRSSKSKNMSHVPGPTWKLLKAVALIVEGLCLFSTSLMNISLAFFLSAVMVPVTVCIYPSHSRLLRFIQAIPMLFISPIVLLLIAVTLQTYITEPFTDMTTFLPQVYTGVQHTLLVGVVQNQLLGNWTWGFMTLVVFPIWLMFWGLLWTRDVQV